MTPAAPPGDPDPGGDKVLPDNIVRYAHMFLALGEGIAPYEVTPELVTVGRYDFGGALPLGMCAHPKIDPATGEMIVFRYGLEAPYLYWAVIGDVLTISRVRGKNACNEQTVAAHCPRTRTVNCAIWRG